MRNEGGKDRRDRVDEKRDMREDKVGEREGGKRERGE